MAARWSPDHLRLHRQLRRDPALLPAGEPVLVAVSGGQDSMALLALLLDLRRLHHWPLLLWHGNHNWRPEAGEQARQLAAWAAAQGLPIQIDTWAKPAPGEAAARAWRYDALAAAAQRLGAGRIATGHTASDRAETLLLNLARGSHRRGLGALAARRPLGESAAGAGLADGRSAGSSGLRELELVRPLLGFSRADTGRICQELALPIWPDPSNHSPRFSRNRVRQEVVPVLEQLHPGAERRISALAERLAGEEQGRSELLELALRALVARQGEEGQEAGTLEGGALDGGALDGGALQLAALRACSAPLQRDLLQHWLRGRLGWALPARQLEVLLARLAPGDGRGVDRKGGGPGEMQLAGGWRLRWRRSTLELSREP
jgi:tRNA(Ile)-lysidine synthase